MLMMAMNLRNKSQTQGFLYQEGIGMQDDLEDELPIA
jgi:hypothetical protein